MQGNIQLYIGIYLSIVNLFAAGLTVYDKRAAMRGSWRVKERTLLLVSLAGGSVAMFAVMRMIRHKTRHAKFMVGIPVIIILQITAIFLVFHEITGGK